jgi:hypothetical protein
VTVKFPQNVFFECPKTVFRIFVFIFIQISRAEKNNLNKLVNVNGHKKTLFESFIENLKFFHFFKLANFLSITVKNDENDNITKIWIFIYENRKKPIKNFLYIARRLKKKSCLSFELSTCMGVSKKFHLCLGARFFFVYIIKKKKNSWKLFKNVFYSKPISNSHTWIESLLYYFILKTTTIQVLLGLSCALASIDLSFDENLEHVFWTNFFVIWFGNHKCRCRQCIEDFWRWWCLVNCEKRFTFVYNKFVKLLISKNPYLFIGDGWRLDGSVRWLW